MFDKPFKHVSLSMIFSYKIQKTIYFSEGVVGARAENESGKKIDCPLHKYVRK